MRRFAFTRRQLLGAGASLGLSAALGGCARSAPALAVPARAPRRGPPHARLVVQEAGDYECSFCADAQPSVKKLLATYGDRIAFVWRDYPLPRHPWAETAAEAAREVEAELGDAAFWRFHDALFAHQDLLSQDEIIEQARSLGADPTRLSRALELHTHRAEIAADRAAIEALAIPGFGTPAFFVGPQTFIGAPSYEELASLVEAEL